MRRVKIVLLLIFAILMLTSCKKDDGSGYIFKYDIPENPKTLDPQTAVTEVSNLIVENIFDGLFMLNQAGDIEKNIVSEYTVSQDGLVYDFVLKEDVYWVCKTDFESVCTANDFVFAFRRLLNPATKSAHASSFYCIKNAKQINTGSIDDVTQLGVIATDKFKLRIELEHPNTTLLMLLTTPPAMPCNEEFFNSTNGKYGLIDGNVASNGEFYLLSWNYDQWSSNQNNMILRKNKKNSEKNPIYPAGLNFFIDEKDTYTNFQNGDSHCYISKGEVAQNLIENGYNFVDNNNAVWGITFNMDGIFKNANLRKSMMAVTGNNSAMFKEKNLIPTDYFVPTSIRFNDDSFRNIAKLNLGKPLSNAESKELFTSEREKIGNEKFSGIEIILPDRKDVVEMFSYVIQEWQANLSFYCNMKIVDQNEYLKLLKSGDYVLALTEITGAYNSPMAFFEQYATGNSSNYSGYSSNKYDAILKKAEQSSNNEESLAYYEEAESLILNEALFIPICNQEEYFFVNEHCSGLLYNPFSKTIIFKYGKYMK